MNLMKVVGRFKSLIICIIALVFVVASVVLMNAPKKELIETNGTIVKFVENYADNGEYESTDTYIDYSVNGKEYKNVKYGAYDSKMKIGDEVVVLYDENDPTFIQTPGSDFVPLAVLGISSVIFIVSLVSFIRGR